MRLTTFNGVDDPVISSDPDKHMSTIFKVGEGFSWLARGFSQVFTPNEEGNLALFARNYLVGQDLKRGAYRITFRRIEMVDNDTSWDYIEPKIRAIP